MPLFNCTNCNAKLKVQDSAAGKRIACPKCKSQILVPHAIAEEPPFASEIETDNSSNAPWESMNMGEPSSNDAFGGSQDLFSMPLENMSQPTSNVAQNPSQFAGWSPHAPSTQNANNQPKKSPAPQGKSAQPLVLMVAGGIGGFILLGLVVILGLMYSFSKRPDDGGLVAAASNDNENKVTGTESSPSSSSTSSQASSPPQNAPKVKPLLSNDQAEPFVPSTALVWVDYYNAARKTPESPYVFQQKTDSGPKWMLGRKGDSDRAQVNQIVEAGVPSGRNLEILRYGPSSTYPLEHPSITVSYPNLLVREFKNSDFEIKRLAAIGLYADARAREKPSTNKSFAWSADGKYLYVLQSAVETGTSDRNRRLLKINTNTWTVEAAAAYLAEDVAVSSEGVVMIVFNTHQVPAEQSKKPFLTEYGVLCPLQNTLDTRYHLVVLDPQTLRLKYSYPIPNSSFVAADPKSSRVFLSDVTSNFLTELDVKSHELVRVVHSTSRFSNLVLPADSSLLFTHFSTNRIGNFDLKQPDLQQNSDLPGAGVWSTVSTSGKIVTTIINDKYTFHDATQLGQAVASVAGPSFGMAYVDDISKTSLIAGVDANTNITARLIQDKADWTIILGKAGFLPSSDGIASRLGDPNRPLTQGFEKLTNNAAPPKWFFQRSPFFVTANPNGSGFVLFTLDGVFVIKPTKSGNEYAFDSSESKTLDLTTELFDNSARKLQLAGPEPVEAPISLQKIETAKGSIFGLPLEFHSHIASVDPETGDLYVVANMMKETFPSPKGTYIIRIKGNDLKGEQNFNAAAATVFVNNSSMYIQTFPIEYGGRKCLACSKGSAIWMLDRESLKPITFQDLPNPLDLQGEPYDSHFKLTDLAYWFSIENKERKLGSNIRLACWQDGHQWINAIEINSRTGKVEGVLPKEQFNYFGESRLLLDPHRSLSISRSVVHTNGERKVLPFTAELILRERPWIVGAPESARELGFVSRYDFQEAYSIALPSALYFYSNTTLARMLESESDDSIIIVGAASDPAKQNASTLIWKLPIAEASLPERDMLASDLRFPNLVVPDQQVKIQVNVSDTKAQARLAKAPTGATLVNGVLQWTPTAADIGVHYFELELATGKTKIVEKHSLTVGRNLLECPIAPDTIRVSDDGKFVVGWKDFDLLIIDADTSTVLHNSRLEQRISACTFFGDSLLLKFDDGKYIAFPVADPSKRMDLSSKQSAVLPNGFPVVFRDKHLVILNPGNRIFGDGLSISGTNLLPSMSGSPLSKYVLHPASAFGQIEGSKDTVFGGVVFDENDNIQNIMSLRWANVFVGNNDQYCLGAANQNLRIFNASYSDHTSGIYVGQKVQLYCEVQRKDSPKHTLIEWFTRFDGKNVQSLGKYLVTPETRMSNTTPTAAYVADKLYFFLGEQFSIVNVPPSSIPIDPNSAAPLRIKSLVPLTLLSASTKKVEFNIEGGKPPYDVTLVQEWGAFSDAIGSSNNKKPLFELDIKKSSAAINLDARALSQALIKNPNPWFEISNSHFIRETDTKGRSSDIATYRNKVNENLEHVLKAKLKGAPVAMSLTISVNDSAGQNALMSHYLIIDIPTEQYMKLFNQGAARR